MRVGQRGLPITTTKKIPVSELPASLIESHAVELRPFCIAFVKTHPEPPMLLGSGTLVRVGQHHGIVTARHVATEIRKLREVGLNLHSKRHSFLTSVEYLDFVLSPAGTSDWTGPDLAFIRLPDAQIGTIASVRSFADLQVQRDRIGSLAREHGLWSIVGFPAERSDLREDDSLPTIESRGFCGVALAPQRYEVRDEFDYYELPVSYSPTNALPESFAGVSGGGLWQTSIHEERGNYSIVDRVLRGVAFYQSAKRDSSRLITCHGELSLHRWLLPRIDERYQGSRL